MSMGNDGPVKLNIDAEFLRDVASKRLTPKIPSTKEEDYADARRMYAIAASLEAAQQRNTELVRALTKLLSSAKNAMNILKDGGSVYAKDLDGHIKNADTTLAANGGGDV